MGMIWVGYRRDALTARQILEDPDQLDGLLDSDDDENSVDLDKAWHALHWLLNDDGGPTDGPLSETIFGGESIGEDPGYGPGRLLPADRVRVVAHALGQIELNSLRTRMDAQAMESAEIYPMIWDEDDVFDSYLAPAYDRLRTFYTAAAAANQAVIQTIC